MIILKENLNSFSEHYIRDIWEDGEINGNFKKPDSHPHFKIVMKLSKKEFYAAAVRYIKHAHSGFC